MAVKAKSQVECRRAYVKEHPEEKAALAERVRPPVVQHPLAALLAPAAPARPTPADTDEDAKGSALADYKVPDAVEMINGMDDPAEVQAILDTDPRKGVQEAAKHRLAELAE